MLSGDISASKSAGVGAGLDGGVGRKSKGIKGAKHTVSNWYIWTMFLGSKESQVQKLGKHSLSCQCCKGTSGEGACRESLRMLPSFNSFI